MPSSSWAITEILETDGGGGCSSVRADVEGIGFFGVACFPAIFGTYLAGWAASYVVIFD